MNIGLKISSKRETVKDGIVDWIRREKLEPGDQILSQNKLAQVFNVNAVTVVKALGDLCEEKILYRENGRGTFVGPYVARTRIRKIGLVLPEKDLNMPENNPEYWQVVQQWFKSFMDCIGQNMTFTSVFVPHEDVSRATLDKVGGFDTTFFLSPVGYEKLIMAMLGKNISCPVFIDEPRDGLNCLCLPFDRPTSIRIGISHLLSLDYRRIAFMCSEEGWYESGIRSYRETMSQAGIVPGSDWVIRGTGNFKDALETLSLNKRFDAVFAANTYIATKALEHFHGKGMRIPGDFGVMADEGLEFAVTAAPYLTSVMYPHRQIISFALSFMEANQYKYKRTYRQPFFGELYPGRTCRDKQTTEVIK